MSYYVDEITMGSFEGCFLFFGLDGYFFEVLECVPLQPKFGFYPPCLPSAFIHSFNLSWGGRSILSFKIDSCYLHHVLR
jgi:hypothetical protein